MNFENFVGQEKAKLAIILNAIDPGCGGVILFGGRGCGKSRLIHLAAAIFEPNRPWIKLPLNALEDALLDAVDLEATVKSGRRVWRPGLLSRARGGILLVDDINLFDPGLLSLVFTASDDFHEQGDGFVALAAMNPEDALLSPHYLDRFGFGVELSPMNEAAERLKILETVCGEENGDIEGLRAKIEQARLFLPLVKTSDDLMRYTNEVSGKYISSGHRGLLFLWRGAKALAAFKREALFSGHIDQVAELVFYHRSYIGDEYPEQAGRPAEPADDQDHGEDQTSQPRGNENRKDFSEVAHSSDGRPESGDAQPADQTGQGSGREEILRIGNEFKVRRLSFAKDRVKRVAHGRRTKTKARNAGGRHLKSVSQPLEKGISLEATLRTAAPYQRIRGRKDLLLIEKDDFRYKRKERRMGHLVLFVVDGSGSMGAKERMIETKGAVKSILKDCYQKRDQVALICFRKGEAKLLLPPTSSVELAARQLADLPVGGKTPLAHGLVETFNIIRRHKIKKPKTRFIIMLITDGRANQSLAGGKIQDEVDWALNLMTSLDGCDYIVIDTENKKNFLKRDLAPQIAVQLGAAYYTIESLKAESFSAIIQSNLAA